MIKTRKGKKYFVFLVAAILIIGVGFSGCTEDNGSDGNGDENGGEELSGTAIYSGNWSGSTDQMGDISGTWEFKVDFDAETVSGSFSGDTSGDISGSVSDGQLDAEGDAAFGTVEWSGDFSDDGNDVSGNWELATGGGSGTWSGSFDREVDENGGGSTETNWNAFEFDKEIEKDGENMGGLKEFTYEHTYSEDGSEKRFEIQTTYIGKTDTEITVTKIDGSTFQQEEMSINIQTYELKHQIEVLQDDENQNHPDSIEMTVYLPVEDFSTEELGGMQFDFSNFWIYAKAEYTDSDGNDALWSYYLNETMQNEMENQENYYSPYTEGDFNSYDSWVLYGLYGFGWMYFQSFTSTYDFEEGSMDVSTPEGSFSYNIEETTIELSGHTFTAYEVTSSAVTFENNVGLKGTFVPSLSVPVYLRVGDDSSYYEMEITSIVIE